VPNFFGSFFPTFGVPKDAEKGVIKAETYALGYALGISVAKAFPATAGPLGLALGLELAPGRGVRVKPAALPLIYLPQPIGVMPPHYYHLPDVMAEPLDLVNILRKPNARANLRARVEADYAIRDAQILAAQRQSERDANAYQRQVLADLQAGRLPDRPTPRQLLGLDKLDQPALARERLAGLPLPTLQQDGGGVLVTIDPTTGLPVPTAPGKDGQPTIVAPAESTSGVGPLVSGFVFIDQFFAANPPDP
jgi:hypothetical protein